MLPNAFASRSHRVRPRSVTLCSDEKHRLSIKRRCKDTMNKLPSPNFFAKKIKKMYFFKFRW